MNIHDIAKQIRSFADQIESQNTPKAAPDPYAELKEAHAAGKVIEFWSEFDRKWVSNNAPMAWCYPPEHYRIKPTPTFQLPPPPPGMEWHREDGWGEGDLPQGWRPLVEGESTRAGDCRFTDKWESWPDCGVGHVKLASACSMLLRTRRPLTFEHAGKSWTWHRPGDPMPCDGKRKVYLLRKEGVLPNPCNGEEWAWDDPTILGWRYADEKKTVPLGPEDVRPFTVIRRKGEAQTWHWRTVSYVDAVKVTCGNRGYGWNELASSYERNESLPLTGKWDASAWEPCSKPA